MKKILLIILLPLLLFSACKNPENTAPAGPIGFPEGTPLTTPEGFSPLGINQEVIKDILEKVDHIDYMFNTIPLSMNQDGSQAILKDMSLISTTAIEGIPTICTPLARKIYMSGGEIMIEADLYFSQECVFQLFIKDEKPLFGNLLTGQGINFYNNLMAEADKTMPEKYRN